MRLREKLRSINPDLLRDVEYQVGKATPQLWHSYGTFPSGTKHTPEHTQQVEEIAGLLINDDLLAELTDHEIGFLILACHFHDLGMSGTEEDNLSEETRDRVRREHAISIGDRIRQHWREFGFPNETTSEILAEICKGHRPKRINGIATWENLDERRIVGPGNDIRIRVVAALVYAADELHIGEDRAPRREEEFNRIENIESRLHWRRHQAVLGPVFRHDKVCFEGTVLTPVFENDLRKSLFKAFSAVKELNNQLLSADIDAQCNVVSFEWKRKWLWTLLIARVCSDLVPRAADKIINDVSELLISLVEEIVSISNVCNEIDSTRDRNTQIHSCIDDLVTRDFLVQENEGFVLRDQQRTAQHIFDVAKQADNAELHILDQDRSQHENSLYQSAFGKRYIRQHLIPHLEAKYSINMSSPGHAIHTKTALESSPTAARIAELIQPPDTVLVQSELFQFACLSGICGDLINDPELILNKEYRNSVDELVANAVQRLPSFLLFVKELAIIRGLTHQQVLEATSSAAENEPLTETGADGSAVSLTLTQKIPHNRPEWSMGHLMLARSRSNATISIKNTTKAPFQIENSNLASPEMPKELLAAPSHLTIGPSTASDTVGKITFSFRGSIRLDEANRTIALDFQKLGLDEIRKPAILNFTPTSDGVASCELVFVEPELTVADKSILSKANSLLQNEDFTVKATLNGNPLDAVDLGSVIVEISELETRLLEVSPDCAVPLFIQKEDRDAIISCENSQLHSVVEGILSAVNDTRPTATTLFLRFATVEGNEYYEEYLGIAPLTFGFGPPKLEGDGISQADIDSQWSEGKGFQLECSFREEPEALANEFREWAKDFSDPFPFDSNDDLQFHYCKTRLKMVFHQVIDRQWYKERKVVLSFRPVSKSERYGVEMEFWQSQNEVERTELLNELLQNAASQELEQKTRMEQEIEKAGKNPPNLPNREAIN